MTEPQAISLTRLPSILLFAAGVCSLGSVHAYPQQAAPSPAVPTEQERLALLEQVIANQKQDDAALFIYERLERLEVQKSGTASQKAEVKTVRAVPAGTGIDRIPVGPDGKPSDAAAYREELEK